MVGQSNHVSPLFYLVRSIWNTTSLFKTFEMWQKNTKMYNLQLRKNPNTHKLHVVDPNGFALCFLGSRQLHTVGIEWWCGYIRVFDQNFEEGEGMCRERIFIFDTISWPQVVWFIFVVHRKLVELIQRSDFLKNKQWAVHTEFSH